MEIHDTFSRLLYVAILFLIGFFTLVGYGVYGLAIWNRKELQKKTTWVSSLAVSDIMMVLHLVLVVVAVVGKHWPMGNFGCQVGALLGLAAGFVSILNIMWIAKDRYYQVCKPEKVGLNYEFFLVCVWGLGLLAASLPAFGFGAYDHISEDQVVCLVDLQDAHANRPYVFLVSLLWFVFPVINIYVYCHKLAIESKGQQMLCTIVPTIFFVCYAPYAVYAALQVTVGLSSVPVWVTAAVHLLPKVMVATNPYVYMQSDPELLKACKEVVSWDTSEEKQE